MAKNSKSKTPVESTSTPVQTPAPVPVPVLETAPAPVVEKAPKTKKPKAQKVEASAVVEQTVTPQVLATPQTENISVEIVEEPDALVAEQSVEFLAKLQQLGVLISALKVEYRTLEKKWSRDLKVALKQSSKRKRK